MSALDLFLELAALPSPPGEERAVADRVLAELRRLGLAVDEDDAGAKVGSNTGNLYSRLELYGDVLRVRYVVDMAEIPAFRERDTIDANRDGTLSADERAAYLATQTA